jgi:hypothetical protein
VENGVATISLDDLIEAALTNTKPYNQQRLGREVERYSRRISKARAPDLPDDLHSDIAQEAITILFEAGPAVLVDGTGKAALRKAVLKAIRAVRASFTPPGQRTRPTSAAIPARVAAEDVGHVIDANTLEHCKVGEGPSRSIDFDLLPAAQALAAIKQVEDRMEIDFILGQASPLVAQSLRLIHLDDEPAHAVAAAADLSRFALNRQVAAFLSGWRRAA